ncbi:MmgE/PrpD family protein [Nocardioides sp.]|uniref:MmgE/PrpD family protein n=1 Tax=Nocardioides sp. TaxID=35761 RepID=UPI0026333D4B|nr:MmgE/PrpD family protein [Nocardioides sp.]
MSAQSGTSGATEAIADFVVRPREAGATAEAVGRVLLDTVAVAIAGRAEPATAVLLDWVLGEGSAGTVPVWGGGVQLSPSRAALVNGTAAHALDWDDAVPSMPMHPGAVLIPALLAQADPSTPGRALVAAYDVGSAAFRAVSEALPIEEHYGRGWHNTSTTGRLAAVAALAHLSGLDPTQTRHALGIVSSSVAGSLANFGTMTKPLHAGQAAHDAVVAVELARRGFTAHPHQLEAPRGFFALYGATSGLDDRLARLPQRLEHWADAWVEDWAIKLHPSCFATHLAVDAALELRSDLDLRQVGAIEVTVPKASTGPLLLRRPSTGLEAKFTLHYTVARALASGPLRLADFVDDRLADPEVDRLMGLVTLTLGDPGPTRVTVMLEDGTSRTAEVAVSYGDARRPLSDADLEAKARTALTGAGWSEADAVTLIGVLRASPYASDLRALAGALRR